MFNEWYLARDKDNVFDQFVIAYPAKFVSIKKVEGCIEYIPNEYCLDVKEGGEYRSGFWLMPKKCKKIFGHCPKKGELLCVKKTRQGWKAEKIELEFNKETK